MGLASCEPSGAVARRSASSFARGERVGMDVSFWRRWGGRWGWGWGLVGGLEVLALGVLMGSWMVLVLAGLVFRGEVGRGIVESGYG